MRKISGGVTSAKGFEAAGVCAGIRKKDKMDMAMVYSKTPCVAAGTFTTNLVKAAPVIWCKDILKNSQPKHAVVLNSGIANACMGKQGKEDNFAFAAAAAKELGIDPEQVFTASTGVIGQPMPMDVITAAMPELAKKLSDTADAGHDAAVAIMTTDTKPKECAANFSIIDEDIEITVGGMSKGSGMIHPNMATMLSVVTTDINIDEALLQEAASNVINETFNMISVDRDTSTNDTFIILANGLAGNEKIVKKDKNYDNFETALKVVCKSLAKKMAADGEGASRLMECKVRNAKTKNDAVVLAKSVISSNLVKAALYGADANWGRILCALGYSGAWFDPDKVDVYLEVKSDDDDDFKLKLVENGMATDYSEETATEMLSQKEVTIKIDVKAGYEKATAWGCDLTYDYVKINGDYRS
ncbi:MAG: bifunctional glutamate N-acetyltransferase/amino-acid acetyltransferase ArgJ [Lachnospiraceae bacterium]|nr:bifunctional glutamate N-acetyltransferase/amino-acid acetyltransferase ArgJ [Lachnospiraceae bacterium]